MLAPALYDGRGGAAECTRCAQAVNVGVSDCAAAQSGCVQARIAEARGSAAEHCHAICQRCRPTKTPTHSTQRIVVELNAWPPMKPLHR